MRMIWLCLVIGPLFYLMLGIQQEPTLQKNLDPKTFESVKMGVYIVAFIILIVTGYMRNYILSRPDNEKAGNTAGQNPMVRKYFVSMVVALAMCESIGVFGLILFFLGKDRTDLYLLTLVAFVTMLFYFPRKEHVRLLAQHSE